MELTMCDNQLPRRKKMTIEAKYLRLLSEAKEIAKDDDQIQSMLDEIESTRKMLDELCNKIKIDRRKGKKPQSFYRFMMSHHLGENSPAGDLAKDMETDEYFPKRARMFTTIQRHLLSVTACSDCINTFLECYDEYLKDCRKNIIARITAKEGKHERKTGNQET